MHYFIITFQVTIDNSITEVGMIGSVSPSNDHLPNTVKKVIDDYYRKKYPQCKHVATVFLKVQRVREDVYLAEKKDFINFD